ncbi:MAG: hypothetical protein E8D45_13085 [Nitrospira sp.]|nr:MAG: hypothetical protein E8D45_13085 [Nitrospira sp.]
MYKRLAQRGVVPLPKSKSQLHIVYASGHSPWDIINIVPALANHATVSTYLLSDHGFDAQSQDWVQVRDRMNGHFVDFLGRLHREKSIDLLLTYYSGHHVSPETIERIGSKGIVTAAFHLDDRLYFRGEFLGGRLRGPAAVAGAYDLNLTQAPESLVKYRVEGAIPWLWPLAANPELCYPRRVPFQYDVSLVGTAYGNRISTVRYLQGNGVRVATFGQGWPSGFLPAEKFQEIYCASRINLNFDDIGFTKYQCGKIRDFEVPMCGALMLGTHNPHLARYFELDSELFTFRDNKECLQQVRRLLSDQGLCAQARKLARTRAVREHTWDIRVKALLDMVGFTA